MLRALLGTIAGFVLGAILPAPIGTHTTVLWILLPAAILFAGVAPAVISFAAGQAAFAVTLVILFNITPLVPVPTVSATRAAAASRRLDDTFRNYLAEQGSKPVPPRRSRSEADTSTLPQAFSVTAHCAIRFATTSSPTHGW
jgi:hypothetical protein